MASTDLVSLSPVDTLVFQLEKDTAPKVILKVTNTSGTKVAFKVKTTQPTWYYVRPNQQVVNVGCSEEVAIVLVDAECSRFLEQASSDTSDRLEKQRFLVQSKAITDEEYDAIVSIAPAQRTDEYMRLWSTGSKETKKKLKVEFQYPGAVKSANLSNKNVSGNVENIRNHVSSETTTNQRDDDDVMSPESAFAELKVVRKKFDDLVEFTVRLTAERDIMVQRLEGTEKELLLSRRKGNQSDSQSNIQKPDKVVEKKSFLKGFSLEAIILAAFLSFIFGRYYKI